MPSPSEVEICNIALTRLGAESIRSFDEDNKRARMCQIMYKYVRDLFLEDYEWTFNTKYAPLALLSGVEHPQFEFVYSVPSDCFYARQIMDEDGIIRSTTKWEVFSKKIATDVENAWLRYSVSLTATGYFPMYFVEALAAQLAIELAPSIVQDKVRYAALLKITEARLYMAREKDAELGVEYKHRDYEAENDTFVNPA